MKCKIVPLAVGTFSLFTFSFSNAQSTIITKGRIFTSDGQKIQFKNLTIGESIHRYQTSSNSSFEEIPVAKTVRIERQAGSEVIKWGLILGLSGFLGSTAGVLQAQNDNSYGYANTNTNTNAVPIIVGITAASTVIGGLIGLTRKKYKVVYSKPKSLSDSWTQRVKIDLTINNHSAIVFRYQL